MPLLQQQPPGQVPAAPAGDIGDTIGGEIPGSVPATEAEQDSHDKVVLAGYTALFENEKSSNEAVRFLKERADNPAKAIADYTFILITGLDDKAGNNIPEEVILPAAAELVENVGELSASVNAFPVDEAVLNYAMELLLPPLAQEYGATEADVQEFMSGIDADTMAMAKETGERYASKQPPRQERAAAAVAPDQQGEL